MQYADYASRVSVVALDFPVLPGVERPVEDPRVLSLAMTSRMALDRTCVVGRTLRVSELADAVFGRSGVTAKDFAVVLGVDRHADGMRIDQDAHLPGVEDQGFSGDQAYERVSQQPSAQLAASSPSPGLRPAIATSL